MANYEVFIPVKPGTNGESIIVEVEASSWLLALRSGMKQIGEQGESLASVMCENRPDGTVVVKDPVSRRMFRIKQLQTERTLEEASEEEIKKAQEEAEAAKLRAEAFAAAKEEANARKHYEQILSRQKMAEEAARKERKSNENILNQESSTNKISADIAKTAAQASIDKVNAERVYIEKERKAKIAKDKAAESATGTATEIKVTRTEISTDEIVSSIGEMETLADSFDIDSVLADLFMNTMDVLSMDKDKAVNFILDLAMDKIEAEAGSVILSDINSMLNDLCFAAARGKVADALTTIRIPRGKGIVGFSVSSGCTLAISDANQNPNFYKSVAEKTGFESRSILCVPIQGGERTFGAIEIVNKKNSNKWTPGEISIIEFLAGKLGENLNTYHDNVSLDVIN